MKSWRKIILALAVVWALAVLVIVLARGHKPTPESVTAYIREDLTAKSAAERAERIKRASAMLNQLSFEDRQQLRHDREQEKFMHQLTSEEQGKFLDATLPTGFRQMMEHFNKMDPVKRKQFVERALTEMKKREGEEPPRNLDDANVQKIANQGLRSFYNDASADVKLDLAPLIEQMQKNGFGR